MRAAAVPVAGIPNLSPTDRFFLWAVRTWAANHVEISEAWRSLEHAFAEQRIAAALVPFDRMLRTLFDGLTRWPDVRCVRCPRLGTEEARLLGALASLQQGDESAARAALLNWVRPQAAHAACRSGRECALLAARAGLTLTVDSQFATDVFDVSAIGPSASTAPQPRAQPANNCSMPRAAIGGDSSTSTRSSYLE